MNFQNEKGTKTKTSPEVVAENQSIKRLKKAIKIIGSQNKLATLCKVSQQAVAGWIAWGNVPARHALTIEKATNGQVTRHDLRPDIYPRD